MEPQYQQQPPTNQQFSSIDWDYAPAPQMNFEVRNTTSAPLDVVMRQSVPEAQVSKYTPPSAPSGPSIEELTFEYVNKQRQLNDAVQQLHRIDNLYEQVMKEAPRRDVEVLPREDPAEVFNPNKTRMKNITPVEQQQEITDLLERQLKRPTTPSPASPPVTNTPRTYPLTDPLATPPTYTPRQPVRGTNPAPGAKPSGLPFPAGRLAAPIVGGAIDFGFRVVAGQPPAQAAAGAVGSTIGGVVGGALGSTVGPVGTFVGGFIGGFVGGFIGDFIYNSAFPSTASVFAPSVTGEYPFNGGQELGVAYTVYANADVTCPGGSANAGTSQTVYGPVTSIGLSGMGLVPGSTGVGIIISAYDNLGNPKTYGQGYGHPGCYSSNLRNINITRLDGQPDTGGNPAPNPIAADNRTPESSSHPGNQTYAAPTGAPAPLPAPNNYAPGGFTSGGTQRGDAPNWVPHGFPAPKSNPNPNTTPSNLGGNFPSPSPNLAPSPSPGGVPSSNPLPNPPGYKLDSPLGKPSGSPSGSPGTLAPPNSIPSGLPTPTLQTPPADGLKPVPQPQPQPQPTPPQTDICESPCIQSMGKKINESSIFWVEVQVTIVICELKDDVWIPRRESKVVKVLANETGNEILKTQTEFDELFKINSELCLGKSKNQQDVIIGIPETWVIKPGADREQIVISYGEKKNPAGKLTNSGYRTMTIAHPNFRAKQLNNLVIKPQERGEEYAEVTLKDNSKIRVYCATEQKAIDYLVNIIRSYVDKDWWPKLRPEDFIKTGNRPGIKKVMLYVVKADYYAAGMNGIDGNVTPNKSHRFT